MTVAFAGSQSKRKQHIKFLLLTEKRDNFRQYLQKRLTPKTGWAVKLKKNLSLSEMSHSIKTVFISLLCLLALLQSKKPKITENRKKKIYPNKHTKKPHHSVIMLFCN